MTSELEQFLQAHVAEATLDSAGAFTLAREKALEKLAAFQFPRATAWVLKVVQAAVSGGSDRLEVVQTATDTEFTFDDPGWTLDQVEASFYDPEVSPERSLDHFKRGLWSVALHEMRPFRLALPGHPGALLWTGERFLRQTAAAPAEVRFTVSHRTLYEGKGLPLLRDLQAARVNAEILSELTRYAFCCPIVLQVNKRRVDALQGCPTHGLGPATYPIRLAFSRGPLPTLGLPPGTFAGFQPSGAVNGHLAEIFELPPRPAEPVQLAVLLSAHVQASQIGNQTTLQPRPENSYLYWVADGVVTDWEVLSVPRSAVSVAMLLSAEGLATDLSGFKLARQPELESRRRLACRALVSLLFETKLSLSSFVFRNLRSAYTIGAGMVLGGLALCLSAPAPGLVIAGGGLFGCAAVTLSLEQSGERKLDQHLQAALRQFAQEWKHIHGRA